MLVDMTLSRIGVGRKRSAQWNQAAVKLTSIMGQPLVSPLFVSQASNSGPKEDNPLKSGSIGCLRPY